MPDPVHLIRPILAHAGEAADPELLHWIKDRLDAILGLPPWAVVALTAGIIALVPVGIIGVYLRQQRRQPEIPAPDPPETDFKEA